MEIKINRDIEAKEFKENFFYHFDKKETFTIAAALICGGAAFLFGMALGINANARTLLMALAAAPAVLIGFFKRQGLGFIDYVRLMYLNRKYSDLTWIGTEDPFIDEVRYCRGRSETHETEERSA